MADNSMSYSFSAGVRSRGHAVHSAVVSDTHTHTLEEPALRLAPKWLRIWGRLRIYLVPILILLILGLPQMTAGRVRVDSGLYGGLSLNAYDNGHFWTLMSGDVPYFRKPPLPFWIHGAIMSLLGRDLWVMRLGGLLAASLCVITTVAIGRQLAGPRVGLLAGIVFTLYDGFFRYIKRFILDYWHTLFILIAVYLFVLAVRKRRPWMIAVGGASLGLAMMCKPLSAIIALPILGVWLLLIGQAKYLWWLIPAALAAIAVAGPWHISMSLLHGDMFIGEYFGTQVLDRGTGDEFEAEPWYWYAAHLLGHYWPWMITLVAGSITWMCSSAARKRDWKLLLLVVTWCGIWLVLTSWFADKRDRYILHIMPILALVSAVWLARWSPKQMRRGAQWWVDGLCAFGVIIAAGLMVSPVAFDKPDETEWVAAYQYVRDHPEETFWIGSINYRDGGRIYMYTGVWPNNRIDVHGKIVSYPPGALVLYYKDQNPQPNPDDEVVFDQGVLTIVRMQE